jgi:hypothetical protein
MTIIIRILTAAVITTTTATKTIGFSGSRIYCVSIAEPDASFSHSYSFFS